MGGKLDTNMHDNVGDMARKDGHIRSPQFYPTWDPELARQSKLGEANQISTGVPMRRELEGKSTMRRDNIQKCEKRQRASDMYDESRRYNPKPHGRDVPLLVDGRPGIDDCAISQYSPVKINQISEDRTKYFAREYPARPITLRKLAVGAFLMSYTRRGDVVVRVNLLRLDAGNTVLEIRYGELKVYKGGFYDAIGDIVREHVLTRVSLFAQTIDGLSMQMVI